jgi:hypothetical protein
MTLQLIRKPPTTKKFNERLKITLEGNHTLKQKVGMLLEAKFWLEHEHGIRFAGPTDVWIGPVDEWGHPLTHFANQNPFADWSLLIRSPYHCAADEHKA